jgi:16S rRNA (guanine966-N2)-methyltransferase
MQVIAGTAKGKRILLPHNVNGVRPMTSRVKASLFDILAPNLYEASVLDLFAGTGQLGIEALSRGASHCTFVELDRKVISVIKQNISSTEMDARSTVLRQNVLNFLKQPSTQLFDLILISPPQYRGLVSNTLKALDDNRHVSENTTIAIQQSSKEPTPLDLTNLQMTSLRSYGSTVLLFYEPLKH